jgi:hypothetical protein
MHAIILTGAALIGLPILLHLIMRQEPKKLPFPAFRFLKLRRRINQRKMRLRHLLLLLLRMFLIALIAVALFQPTLISDQFNIKGEQPIACVIVIDTSPSMGYVLADRSGLSEARQRGLRMLEETAQGPWTALDDARFRALELIDELPPGSRVAVVDTADRDAYWALSLAEARKKIRDMKRPRASSRSVTLTLEMAYGLFARSEQDAEAGQENMPRLLCVLSDRTVPSWDVSRTPDLVTLRDRAAKPAEESIERPIHSTFIDVGVDKPLNLAITGVEMKPQIVAANKPVEFTVVLEATGSVQENTVLVRFDEDAAASIKQPVRVEPGTPVEKTFRKEGLKPGLHQAEITLETADALPSDNIRYLTFRVREPRKVLVVADTPRGLGAIGGGALMVKTVTDLTFLLRSSLESTAWYACDTLMVNDFLDPKFKKVGEYEAVIFAGLVDPPAEVWEKVSGYVKQGGGQLVVMPGGDELQTAGQNQLPPGYANEILPGPLRQWIEIERDKEGISWTWDSLKAHPLLNDFREWQKNPKIDFVAKRPRVWGYWDVEVKDKPSVIVYYADDPEAEKRRPALLEKQFQRGRILLFTTPMDGHFNLDRYRYEQRPGVWNDYPATSFYLVLTNLALRYLTGDTEDAVFNYASGTNVLVKWPLDAATRSKTYYLYGPDVADADVVQTRGEKDSYLRLAPDKLRAAGNYAIVSDPSDKDHPKWRDGFSLNPTRDESNLERVKVEDIEALFGSKSVAAADKERKLRDILSGKFSAPIELFPFLMILLLLFLAFENLLSNKFYKQPKPPASAAA